MKHTKLVWDYTGLSLLECPFMRLTDDVIRDILYGLPVKSLGRCALVSKPFNSLISDPKFAIAHLEFTNKTKAPLTLVSYEYNVISKLELNDPMDISNGVRLVVVEDQFSMKERDDYYWFMIGSCDGLVCIYLKSRLHFNADLMFIWNPVTGKRKEIVLPNLCDVDGLRENASWFGYLPSINEYKIFLPYKAYNLWFGYYRCYMYSFITFTWREISVSNWCFASGCKTVFVNEALHCVSKGLICKFNLVEETFEKIPFPIGELGFWEKCLDISLGVIGKYDCLCVVFVHYHVVVMNLDNEEDKEKNLKKDDEKLILEGWMLQEYGNWNSWKKWCSIDLKGVIIRNSIKFLGFTYTGFLCFQGEYGIIVVDPMKDPPSYASARIHNLCNYVESHISPNDLL